MNLRDAQISWQAQHFVNLHVQISWQAQHFVNLHASPNLDAEASCARGLGSRSDHGRNLHVLAEFVAGTALCEPPCADFVAGTALCEPRCADFVAGALLCEPPCADVVAGTALCEPPRFSEPRRESSAERRLRDGLGSWSDHGRIMLGSFSESCLHCD